MSVARPVLNPHAKLSAGQRDQEVTIQQRSGAVGSTRFPVDTWSTLTALEWMARTDARATERFASGQMSASIETIWEMNYRADMDPDLVNVPATRRLVHQGRIYDITAATTIGPKRGIELLTIARVE